MLKQRVLKQMVPINTPTKKVPERIVRSSQQYVINTRTGKSVRQRNPKQHEYPAKEPLRHKDRPSKEKGPSPHLDLDSFGFKIYNKCHRQFTNKPLVKDHGE